MEKEHYIIIRIKSKDDVDFDADVTLEGDGHKLSQAFANLLMSYPPFREIVLEAMMNIFSGFRPHLKDIRIEHDKKV